MWQQSANGLCPYFLYVGSVVVMSIATQESDCDSVALLWLARSVLQGWRVDPIGLADVGTVVDHATITSWTVLLGTPGHTVMCFAVTCFKCCLYCVDAQHPAQDSARHSPCMASAAQELAQFDVRRSHGTCCNRQSVRCMCCVMPGREACLRWCFEVGCTSAHCVCTACG